MNSLVLTHNTAKLAERIAAGDNVNKGNKYKRAPLYIASQHVYTDMVRLLIQAGADIHARTDDERTPLHAAANHGDGELMWLLVKAGGNVNARDDEGSTALHVAARNGNLQAAEVLLMCAAYVNARQRMLTPPEYKWTPLHAAARHSKSQDFLELIIQHGGDVMAVGDFDGLTALAVAEDESTVAYLVSAVVVASLQIIL